MGKKYNAARWICQKPANRCDGTYKPYGVPVTCPLAEQCRGSASPSGQLEYTYPLSRWGWISLGADPERRKKQTKRRNDLLAAFCPEVGNEYYRRYRESHRDLIIQRKRERYYKTMEQLPAKAKPERDPPPCGGDHRNCPYDGDCHYPDWGEEAAEKRSQADREENKRVRERQAQKRREDPELDRKLREVKREQWRRQNERVKRLTGKGGERLDPAVEALVWDSRMQVAKRGPVQRLVPLGRLFTPQHPEEQRSKGVATLTAYEPETGMWYGLGHKNDSIFSGMEIRSVTSGRFRVDEKGHLHVEELTKGKVLGRVSWTGHYGAMGWYDAEIDGEAIPVGDPKCGTAWIVNECLEDGKAKAEIVRLDMRVNLGGVPDTVTVLTGCQTAHGMSGSPVLQDGKLVAVIVAGGAGPTAWAIPVRRMVWALEQRKNGPQGMRQEWKEIEGKGG